jgi:hypothetical protein
LKVARHLGQRGLTDGQAVLGAAGETETAQGNIQDWLQLAVAEPGLKLLTEEEIAAVMLFILCIFIGTTYIIPV